MSYKAQIKENMRILLPELSEQAISWMHLADGKMLQPTVEDVAQIMERDERQTKSSFLSICLHFCPLSEVGEIKEIIYIYIFYICIFMCTYMCTYVYEKLTSGSFSFILPHSKFLFPTIKI